MPFQSRFSSHDNKLWEIVVVVVVAPAVVDDLIWVSIKFEKWQRGIYSTISSHIFCYFLFSCGRSAPVWLTFIYAATILSRRRPKKKQNMATHNLWSVSNFCPPNVWTANLVLKYFYFVAAGVIGMQRISHALS